MNARYCNGGKFTSRDDWTHPDIKNDTTELIAVTEGSFCIEEETADGFKTYELEPGDIIYLDAGKLHRGVGSSIERVSFYWIHFYLPEGEFMPIKHLRLGDVYSVTLLCRQILHYEAKRASAKVMDSLLCVLNSEIDSQDIKREPLDSLAEKVVEWLRINADRQLNSTDVSERFGYNEDYISRLLKQQYGHGLKQMIVEKRMDYLKYMLLEKEMTLTEIASHGGFPDVKLFLKFFAYHEGITPTRYREIYKNGHTNNR